MTRTRIDDAKHTLLLQITDSSGGDWEYDSHSFLSPYLLSPPHLTSFHLSFPPLLLLSLPHSLLLTPFLPPSLLLTPSLSPLQNVPVSDEDVHTPLQQGGYEGGGGGEEEDPEEPDYALPPDAGEVMIHLLVEYPVHVLTHLLHVLYVCVYVSV